MLSLKSASLILVSSPNSRAKMLRAEWVPYNLDFRFMAVTSRERMKRKSTYFVRVYDTSCPEVKGWGECALFRG